MAGLVAGTGLVTPSVLRKRETHGIREKLSLEEQNWVDKSSLAKDLEQYFGKGYSCSESILMLALKYLGKSEKLVWAAAGFGGGIYQRDLCGFLTGGIMAIGLAAGDLRLEKKEAKVFCKETSKKYWSWWKTIAPLHCVDIRTKGTTGKTCLRLGYLAATRLEELIQR